MSQLTSEEVIALNTLLDGKPIFGIPLKREDASEEERLQQVEKSLEEKEFIKDNDLTDLGIISTKCLEDYKQAETYVFLNSLRMALTEADRFHIIELGENTYEFSYVKRLQFLYKLMEATPFLQKTQKKTFFGFEEKKMSQEELEAQLEDSNQNWKGIFVLQKYQKERMVSFQTIYYNDDVCYRYDYVKGTQMERGPQDVREDLIDLFEIREVDDGQNS